MRAHDRIRSSSRGQGGYAVLMVMFLTTVLLISATVAIPNLLTAGRRQREDELIWRGQQYARGIRLYYRKNARFPQSLEDLTKPKNGLRYLRQAYKDPMNRADGSWRLIYIGPGGEIIGSVKQHTLLQQSVRASTIIGQQRAVATAATTSPGTPFPLEGTNPAATPPTQDGSTPAAGSDTGDDLTGKVFGGFIIGVGSKVNRKSIKIFDGSTNYREWEFLFSTGQGGLGGPGQAPAAPLDPANPQQPPQKPPLQQ